MARKNKVAKKSKVAKKNKDVSFESFLAEAGILHAVDESVVKRVLAWQIAQEMSARKMQKSELARRMETSRTQVDRLLDPAHTGVTLHTMHRAAAVLGKRLQISLVEPAAA
jgi:DNA-binding Xre family transcriptional regulator